MSRILFVMNASVGGAAISAIQLMRGLKADGHACFAVFPPGPEEARRDFETIADGVAEFHMPWWNRRYGSTLWKRPIHFALAMLRSRLRVKPLLTLSKLIADWKIDLVHSNTSLNLEGALAARLAKKPHVWHVREEIGSNSLYRFWLPEPVLAQTFTSLSDELIATSESSCAFFRRNGIGDQVSVVYDGVPFDAFDAHEGAALRDAWGVAPEDVLVGMVANLTSRMKRHDLFIEAAGQVLREHPATRFVIIGSDPEQEGGYAAELEYTRKNKQLARECGVSERMTYAGHVADIPSAIGALDVVVHPADQEGYGRVAVEAMAGRRPIVVADGGGIKEIVEEGTTGYKVTPRDPQAFAEAMSRLVANDELRKSIGDSAHAWGKDRFSLARSVADISAIYERALAS